MTREELRRGIECLLFVSDGPLGAREMSLALDTPEELVAEAAADLVARDPSVSGIVVQAVAGGWQMVTSPEFAVAVARFVGKRAQRLSKAALETLAIVAYNQPCTQAEVEFVRGVDSTGVLKGLIDRGLVQEAGRKEGPGRPILYQTTQEFLVYFGLNSLADLPDQAELEARLADAPERMEAAAAGGPQEGAQLPLRHVEPAAPDA